MYLKYNNIREFKTYFKSRQYNYIYVVNDKKKLKIKNPSMKKIEFKVRFL